MDERSHKVSRLIRRPQYVFAFVALAPIVAIYTIIRIIPIGGNIILSFYQWKLVSPIKFVGLENYVKLFHDRLFFIAIKNTFILALLSLIITLLFSLGLALILNREKLRFTAAYELVYFTPFFISWVPLAVIWRWIYDPTYGILNYVLSFIGISPQGWLVNPKLSLYSIVALIVWRHLGINTLIFSVGLKNIPSEYHNAAKIDGAGGLSLFRYITLPLLKPIVLYLVVMFTILNFTIFAPVYVMTVGSQGAPGEAVRVIVLDIYENGFRYLHMGYAAAESTILLLGILLLALVEFRLIKHEE